MATVKQMNDFIKQIAPLIVKYAKVNGYPFASPIIAQACLESAYGLSSLGAKYHNYFGLKCGSSWKGKSVNLKTAEEYTVGTYTNIKANFRVYDSMEEGVRGYFAFINCSRYANLHNATTPKQYLEYIKKDGYATSSKYVDNVFNVILKHNLTQYDTTNIYYSQYKGDSKSIVGALSSVGEKDTSFKHRTKIANANNIKVYLGTSSQNLTLVSLLKQGLLIKA